MKIQNFFLKSATAFLCCYILFTINVKGQTTIVANSTNTSLVASSTSNNTWTDVGSVTVNLNAGKDVLVLSTMESDVTDGNSDLTCNYRLSDGSTQSPAISRYVESKDYDDFGLSATGYIFNYPSGSTGDKVFYLQHSKSEPGTSKQFHSKAIIVAMVIEDANVDIPNSIKTTGDVTTTSTSYEQVTGTKTDAISLTKPGGIYLTTSFTTYMTTDITATVGYVLRYSTDGTNFTEIPNASISRTNSQFSGVATISVLFEHQDAITYYFDVAHKTNTGTLTTSNLSLCAVGLVDASGKVFPTFKITGQSDDNATTGWEDAATILTTSVNGTNKLFMHSTFNMSSASVVNPAAFQLEISGTGASFTPQSLQRYVPAGGTGSGGIVGLATGLNAYTDYTVKLQHKCINSGVTLTTSNANLVGFQLTNVPTITWDGSESSAWNTTGNWDGNIEPISNAHVVIANVGTAPVIANNVDADCYDLTINSGASLTIQSDASGTGSLIVNGSASGNITVERYLTDNMWHQVTPSTTGVTVADFNWSDNPESWLLSHDESELLDPSWTYMTDLGTELTVGQGYMVWLDNTKSNATASMEGNLQSTTLSPTLAYTDDSHGWNLIGNPFSSAIDYDEGSWGSNTTGFVYVWDNAYNTTGDYRVSDGDLTGNIIPIGQGFFVDATSSAAFDIPSAARVHSTQAFYKSTNNNTNNYFRLQLDGNGYGNTVFVGFPENGTDGTDYKGDARKLYSSLITPQLFAVENNVELCVNANKPLNEGESKIVPLHLIQIVDGEYTLTITGLDQLENISITIEDVKTGSTQDLRKLPVYTFTASSNDTPERFLLHFAWSPDEIGEDIEQDSKIDIYSYGKDIYIRTDDDAINKQGNVYVYDLLGREILQQPFYGNELVKIPVNLNNTYVVVKVVKEGALKVEKILIK